MAKGPSKRKASQAQVRIYTLVVGLHKGPVTQHVALAEPSSVSRSIAIRGDQTLEALHRAIVDAFERTGDYSYEFQFDAGSMHPEGRSFVLPGAYDVTLEAGTPAAGRVTETTLDALGVSTGQHFAYCPDNEDDWWHSITVEKVTESVPRGSYPKVTHQVGDSPFRGQSHDHQALVMGKDEGADTACLVAEVHLDRREFRKAIAAFSRAIESNPTADAFQGRAKAYRELAEEDDRAAERLR